MSQWGVMEWYQGPAGPALISFWDFWLCVLGLVTQLPGFWLYLPHSSHHAEFLETRFYYLYQNPQSNSFLFLNWKGWNDGDNSVILRRNRILGDLGNESDIKVRAAKSKILELLKPTQSDSSKSFIEWKTKIDIYVMEEMSAYYNKKSRFQYQNTVGDLLKFIRNIRQHINEKKNEKIKAKIGEPSKYFQEIFPDLFLYVYQRLHNTEYEKYFLQDSPSKPALV